MFCVFAAPVWDIPISTRPCPTGFSFPFEFGFVPWAVGGDGDPPFFISYNEVQGKKFKSRGFGSRQRALDLVEEARQRARKKGG